MSLKKNVLANYLGQVWVALMGLAFIPLYIKYLGIESYGLIGLFAMLQVWFVLLDMGMTPTLNREMARFTGGAHEIQAVRDLLRSIEVLAFGIAIVIALSVWFGSGWLASVWLKSETLTFETVKQALVLIGGVVALRFVEGIYRSCLLGLQYQVLFNVVNSLMASLRAVGAVIVLVWISPTIDAFFVWQGVVSGLALLALAVSVYKKLPSAERSGRFSLQALRGVWRFAGGVMGITFLSLLLMQADKVLLSNLLRLSEYGYYMLASVVAGALYMVASPIGQAWLPRLTKLQKKGTAGEFIFAYHFGSQLIAVIFGSVAVFLVVFAEPVLLLWSRDPQLADSSSMLVSLLALGNLLNGLMWMPYRAQLAYGWTSLSIRVNAIAVLIIVPAIIFVAPRYGAEGTAWLWILLNTGYLLIGVHFMYLKILRTEKWYWYKNDILKPIGMAFITGFVIDSIISVDQLSLFLQMVVLGFVCCFIMLAAGTAAPLVREKVLIHGAHRICGAK
ncbi:MAG: oligosaccharide flippase family protein [Gammaproteobacteria bacterium]|nr:oligosaccharide flippase family protein [Gammaproteobacteria bacterium]